MQNRTTERPLYFYVANLGSELQRFFAWKEKGDTEAMQNAYNRAVSILDKIKSFNNKSANEEMSILHKAIDKNILDRGQVSSYFNPFALRAIKDL
jgi:murein L,D-transpeptidase YafK